VQDDAALDTLFAKYAEQFGTLDILIHAVAFAQKEDLEGTFVDTSRQGFALSLSISAYSLVALAQRAHKLMPPGSSITTLTYYGSEKVMPGYNVMGVAKAALEASTRYLAYDLGGKGIRVNAISPGPINTLSARGIAGFRDMLKFSEAAAPLGALVTPENVGKTAIWLCSEWGSNVTGQVIYVDGGYSIMGLPIGALEKAASGTGG
jgi:enoyl-[acyl-carrier protein] reductase I